MSSGIWCHEKLSPVGQQMWDALAVTAEDDFFIFAKHFCDLDLLEGYVHEPICRFMTAPVLGDKMLEASVAETDWIPADVPVVRGSMRGGDPFGEPFQRVTRLSNPPRKRQLIRVPRGAFKTSLVGAYILWLLRRDQNKSAMVMAADDDASSKILYYCDRHIRSNPKLKHYWRMNEWISPGDTWTVMRKFIATRTVNRANDPSIWATSPGSVKAGPHPDLIFIDDIVNEKVLKSDEALEKVNSAYDQLSPMLMDDAIVWVLGTPWTLMDLYESLERRKVSETQFMFDIYTRDVINPDGTFWWKERMSEEFLKSKWIEAREANPPKPWMFWSQFRMKPSTEAEQSLALEKINWVMQDEVDKMMPSLRRIGGVDPADEKIGSGDWALWAWGTTADRHYWDLWLDKCSAKADMAGQIVKFAVQWSLEVLLIENTVISRRLIPDIREKLRECGSRCVIVEVEPHSQSKVYRIAEVENGFGGVMAQGRLHLRDANYAAKNELRTFPGGTYTYDGLDIASYVTAWVAANAFYPRKREAEAVEMPLPPEIAAAHADARQALENRDAGMQYMIGHEIYAEAS